VLLLAASGLQAQERGEPDVVLPGVVVVGTPAPSDPPASVDTVDADAVAAAPKTSVSELLRRIPGVVARDRQNLAQDVQVTIRGFGARTTFGVRGLRIYVDGIPASMPDGQGQVSHVPLAALESVEVLRGPFSALYGNASGGVIQFFSKDPAERAAFGVDAAAGADGLRRLDLALTGPWSRDDDERDDAIGGGYRIDAGRLRSDGYRRHSRARRDIAQARLTAVSAGGTRVALTANGMDLAAQDPQGLAMADVLEDPRAASDGALAFDTRKTVRQRQVGVRVEQATGDAGVLVLGLHGGQRKTWQMLSIPAFVQQVPGSGGGVIDLDRAYAGLDARWTFEGRLGQRPFALTVGTEIQRASEWRRGYENFAGDVLGVVGRLRRDQRDSTGSHDAFAEARWRFAPRWQATLGVRRSQVAFDSVDRYIAPGNPDDSGGLDFGFTSPVVGLLFEPRGGVDLYLNAGRGFETPSASELAYRPDGASGMNDALRPSRTDSIEAGMRLRRAGHALGVALFDTRTRDELVVATNEGGRSTYANAAETSRNGWELSASGPLGDAWHYALAWTALDARYGEALGGHRLPSTAARTGWAELRWTPRDALVLFASALGNSRLYADDDNTAWAPGQATLDLGAKRTWRIGDMPLVAGLRIGNVLDRTAIGSVIVNASGGRYFEPAPGRSVTLTLELGRAAVD
jgi:iron complex outermembrane receptor protein